MKFSNNLIEKVKDMKASGVTNKDIMKIFDLSYSELRMIVDNEDKSTEVVNASRCGKEEDYSVSK